MKIHVNYNNRTGFYEANEKGITYQMELSEMDNLKKTSSLTAADWYLSLPLDVRKKVARIGVKNSQKDDFYPDAEYD